jgi:hypothetical protein
MNIQTFLIGIVVLMLVTSIALVFSIKYYRRHSSLRVFPFYICFSLLTDITSIWERTGRGIGQGIQFGLNICYNIFIVFDFLVFSLFILYYVNGPSRRLAIKGIVFIGMLLWIWFVHFDVAPGITYIGVESMLLIFPCLIYYYELFVTLTPRQFNREPSFWIVTGLFLVKACSIPLWLTLDRLGRFAFMAFSLNVALYIVLFILLIKAYRCSPGKRVTV